MKANLFHQIHSFFILCHFRMTSWLWRSPASYTTSALNVPFMFFMPISSTQTVFDADPEKRWINLKRNLKYTYDNTQRINKVVPYRYLKAQILWLGNCSLKLCNIMSFHRMAAEFKCAQSQALFVFEPFFLLLIKGDPFFFYRIGFK